MQLLHQKAELYAEQFSSPLDELRERVTANTIGNHPHAHMLSSRTQGKLLQFISSMVSPLKILEIGTFTGFSALCLCEGLQPDGVLHTVELRSEDAATAQAYFAESPYANRIKLHVGDANEIVKALGEEWDMVFIDADKVNYINYYELTLPALKQGGWLIADNVLFHGQVLEEQITGKNALAIHAFNEHIKNDPRVEHVMLTIRDGLMLIKKI
jgi:caffeoyl-CoA O-methyltransferase